MNRNSLEIAFGWEPGHMWLHTTLEDPWPLCMILEVCTWDGLWTLSLGLSQIHGHGSWLVCVKWALPDRVVIFFLVASVLARWSRWAAQLSLVLRPQSSPRLLFFGPWLSSRQSLDTLIYKPFNIRHPSTQQLSLWEPHVQNSLHNYSFLLPEFILATERSRGLHREGQMRVLFGYFLLIGLL